MHATCPALRMLLNLITLTVFTDLLMCIKLTNIVYEFSSFHADKIQVVVFILKMEAARSSETL